MCIRDRTQALLFQMNFLRTLTTSSPPRKRESSRPPANQSNQAISPVPQNNGADLHLLTKQLRNKEMLLRDLEEKHKFLVVERNSYKDRLEQLGQNPIEIVGERLGEIKNVVDATRTTEVDLLQELSLIHI
eukprot:TRINITY_DN21632_c0_g1_i1.p2 TRINITY_DN21632_c0_g1~~TRINITY_DN21632_c0_g1_i1.p2  ORF type:complete len:150 (+),score=48.57 TRINITY_DN21632_c0_g1_i1:60-452(+)